MATPIIKHASLTGATANLEALVDGPKWDAAHTITGLENVPNVDTTNADNITTGTLPAARLPNPTAGALGGVKSLTAPSHQFLTSIGTDGLPTAAQPAASDIAGLAASATTDTTNAGNISSGTLALARGGTGQVSASAAFDALSPATSRGDIIYRNATANVRLAAGTAGFVLQTNGPGADPSWAAAAVAATATPLVDGAAAVGVATKYAREDHVHPTDATRAPLVNPAFTGTININGHPLVTTGGGYTTILDGAGVTGAFIAGSADPTNFYRNDGHRFQNAGATVEWASLRASGLTVNVPISAAPAALTGSTLTTQFSLSYSESLSAGSGFFLPVVIGSTRTGGTGHRETMHVTHTSFGAPVDSMNVGAQFAAYAEGGSGDHFGLNSYSWVKAQCAADAQSVSFEANTQVERNVIRKVGIQIVDVAGSTSSGTVYDAGMIIGCQPGGVGYSTGIRFGFANANNELGIYPGGSLISASTNTVPVSYGLKFDGMTFLETPILLKAGNKGIYWGAIKEGGAIVSETTSGAGDIAFGSNSTTMRIGGVDIATVTPIGLSTRGLVSHAGNLATFGGSVLNLAWTGSAVQLWVDNSNTGTISVTSDYRIKKDVADAGSALAEIRRWRPITYTGADWGIFEANDHVRHSFIAHELQAVSPDCVVGEKDGEQPQSLDLVPIVARLARAVQELDQRMATLEA